MWKFYFMPPNRTCRTSDTREVGHKHSEKSICQRAFEHIRHNILTRRLGALCIIYMYQLCIDEKPKVLYFVLYSYAIYKIKFVLKAVTL